MRAAGGGDARRRYDLKRLQTSALWKRGKMGGWQILKIGLTGGKRLQGPPLAYRRQNRKLHQSGADLASQESTGSCHLAHSSWTTQLHQTPNAAIIEAIGEGVSPTLLVNFSRTRCILYDQESVQQPGHCEHIYDYPLRRRFSGLYRNTTVPSGCADPL